jgi:hypothetical protein
MLRDSQHLTCSLRSWDQAHTVKSIYEIIWAFGSSWTSDALVVFALADWPKPTQTTKTRRFLPFRFEVTQEIEDDGVVIVEHDADAIDLQQRRPRKWDGGQCSCGLAPAPAPDRGSHWSNTSVGTPVVAARTSEQSRAGASG